MHKLVAGDRELMRDTQQVRPESPGEDQNQLCPIYLVPSLLEKLDVTPARAISAETKRRPMHLWCVICAEWAVFTAPTLLRMSGHLVVVRCLWGTMIAFRGDLEDDFRAVPFRFVLDEVDLAIDDVPTTFLPGTNSVIFCVLR